MDNVRGTGELTETIETYFDVREPIARGGFGEICLGKDRATGQTVAVKRLLEGSSDPAAEERFRREAQLLARVDSPHVVRVLSFGRDAHGRPCMVLEWLAGEDVAQRFKRAPLSLPESVEVARQAAIGLCALHAAGIVHRDVKPANFFLVEDPSGKIQVKLIDLGIARVEHEPGLTVDGLRVGTPAYMSPEQARGSSSVTASADIYALGVVLYELLSGTRPFVDRDPFALLAKIILQEPPPLRERVPTLPPELEQIVRRAMARTPEERFSTAAELAAALAHVNAVESEETLALGQPSARPLAHDEIQTVTVLFSAFDPRTAIADAERAGEIVVRHGGESHLTVGAGAVGVFGAQFAAGEGPLRAAHAALALAEAIPGARVGVATCRVRAGARGLEQEAIERGASLAANAQGMVRVDAPTARLIEAHFDVDVEASDGEHVLRAQDAATGAVAGPRFLGRPTTILGRDRDLSVLDGLYAECVGEPAARAIIVTAAAGVGKSLLRYEWLARVSAQDPAPFVWLARGDATHAASPFGIVAQLLRSACDIRLNEAPEQSGRKLAERLAVHLGPDDAARAREFLGQLLEIPPGGEASVHLRAARQDPVLMADQMRRAWEDFVLAESSVCPVILALEDVHWCDEPSVAYIDAVLRVCEDRPVFVLALARPEVHERFAGLWRNRGVQELRLGPLSRKAAESLVRRALGDAVDEALLARLVTRGEGNAFLLEELVRAVIEGRGEDVTEAVMLVVQSRLARLESEARRVLRAASVYGQVFWLGGVGAVLGGGEHGATVGAVISDLVRREVVGARAQSSIAGEKEYVFRHALVRDAAYAMQADDDRVASHARAGAWLESAGERDATVLAAHFESGRDSARAARWYLRAAEQALDAGDLSGAIARAGRAEENGAAGEMLGGVRAVQSEVHRWRGEADRSAQCGLEAIALLPRGSERWHHAVRYAVHGSLALGRGDWIPEIIDDLDALEVSRGIDATHVVTLSHLATLLAGAGQRDLAARAFAKMEPLRTRWDEEDPYTASAIRLAFGTRASVDGNGASSVRWWREATPFVERSGNFRATARLKNNLGFGYLMLGAYERAEALLREAHALAIRMGLGTYERLTLHNLGATLTRLGRLEEGTDATRRALEAYEREGNRRMLCATRIQRALQSLQGGDLDAAEQFATAAAAINDYPSGCCAALAITATVQRMRGDVPGALASMRASMELYERGGAEEDSHRVLLEFAETLRAAGLHAESETAIDRALALIETSTATIDDPEIRRGFLERVEEVARALELSRAWRAEMSARPSA